VIDPITIMTDPITGEGEPGAMITLTDENDDPIVCTNAPVVVAADGTWSCDLANPLAE
jgi:hypothetical protein